MTITLPQPPPAHVWIHSPAWLFANYHWSLVLAVGLLLLLFGTLWHRSERSYGSGLMIVLAFAPLLVALIGAGGSAWFHHHPNASTKGESWSRTQDVHHDFKIPYSHVAHTFAPPVRDAGQELAYVNAEIKKHTGATPLHAGDMPTIMAASDDATNREAAAKGSPFLIDGNVYTCAFLGDDVRHDKSGALTYAHISSATCVQGSKSIFVTIR